MTCSTSDMIAVAECPGGVASTPGRGNHLVRGDRVVDSNIPLKTCSKCGCTLDHTQYNFPNGRSACRSCVRASHKAWRYDNADRVRSYRAKARAQDQERVRGYAREWLRRNLDYARANRLNDLARRVYGVGGVITKEEIAAKFDAQHGRCAYCGVHLTTEFDVDHVFPMSRGGMNTVENIAVSCHGCNASKGSLTVAEWVAALPGRPKSPLAVAHGGEYIVARCVEDVVAMSGEAVLL